MRINEHAIEHIMESAYAFPTGPNEIVLRIRTAKNDFKEAFVVYESKYKIAKSRKKKKMEKKLTGRLYDWYSVTLPIKDVRLAYVFVLNDGEKDRYFSEDGLTDSYDFKLGFYNFFQFPYINESDIHKKVDWTKNAVFYQIFVDRFNIGDKEADKSYVDLKWGDRPTPKSFAGGDLKGIIEKLDYIKGLGVNALYLTPIFKSVSNHKYDISDYYAVDEQFGTNEDLKELVKKAHEKGIRVVLDAVFNHCSERMSQFQDVLKKGSASKYHDWFIIDGEKPDKEKRNYEMFASCTYMPKLNTSNPEVVSFLNDIGTHYVKEYDIDGWRLDVSDEVSHSFWRSFRQAVKNVREDCILIGENWHDASSFLRGDQYDSIMNYAFTKACLDYFAWKKISATEMAERLNDILARNTDIVNSMMFNLLDSHDTLRLYTETGEDIDRFNGALTFLYLFPGVPCIFYGTELHTPGGYDPDCRRCMDWEGIKKGLYKDEILKVRELGKLRKKYDLANSEYRIYAENNVLCMERKVKKTVIRYLSNLSDKDVLFNGKTIKAHSYSVCIEDGRNKNEEE